ncbi:Protein CrcB homolog [uncultured Eubacteriales bacterium]|uniref:Fluoride-specific ion channel FluC n=1 Tax=uncultured Eubacteriales bacterium TaxID=172733 RepID=A0A212KI65_9FIRM|nr:Protein CrcB homolog [uncultured Eubacteriales bacterium]
MAVNCLLVALGGGMGAMARYLLGLLPVGVDFPVTTLAINFIGAVVIGAVTAAAGLLPVPDRTVLFLKTGLCGGFTTFSTFSLETMNLLEKGRTATGVIYASGSVVLCLIGVLLGRGLAKLMFGK